MTRLLRWLWFFAFVRPVAFAVLGLNLRHRERLPRSGPAVIVANHNSHFDVLVLLALFPYRSLERLRPVAAADYIARNRLMYWFVVRIMGAVPLKRRGFCASEGHPLGGCSAALARGDILILFPEGTRGEPERLGRFKPGIVHLAKRFPQVPVVPVFLHGAGKALPKGKIVPVPFTCDVLVGNRVRWNG
ncbi:MAG: lysophospholipid acyltransferase family protein, partial [Alphaproteobacteria bacterium]